jgi:hypothetical protein
MLSYANIFMKTHQSIPRLQGITILVVKEYYHKARYQEFNLTPCFVPVKSSRSG